MQSLNGTLIFSATDLSNFLACPHLTLLSRRGALGGPQPPRYDDPGLELLRRRGKEHEQRFLASLREGGRRFVDLSDRGSGSDRLERYRRHAEATVDAMRSGVDVIYQGFLFDGSWLGYPDFLCRVERPSALGTWSYEVVDAKLAREAKAGALLQVLVYADLLERVQGHPPEFVHLALGVPDTGPVKFRVKDYVAYFRAVRKRFLELIAGAPVDVPLAPDLVPHCDICDWYYVCDKERRAVDHLCFVAGTSRQQCRTLDQNGI